MEESKKVENKDKDLDKNEEIFEKLPENYFRERKSVMIKPSNTNKIFQRINTMNKEQKQKEEVRRKSFLINTQSSSTPVGDMLKNIRNLEKEKKDKEEEIKEEIKKKKVIDKRKMSDRIDNMLKEQKQKEEVRRKSLNINTPSSTNVEDMRKSINNIEKEKKRQRRGN